MVSVEATARTGRNHGHTCGPERWAASRPYPTPRDATVGLVNVLWAVLRDQQPHPGQQFSTFSDPRSRLSGPFSTVATCV